MHCTCTFTSTLLKVHFYLQVTTERIEKENSSTNLQNTLLQRSSPNKTQGGRLIVISPNYWAANLSKQGGMHSVLAKEYGQCLLKVISKGVENSKKIIANGI